MVMVMVMVIVLESTDYCVSVQLLWCQKVKVMVLESDGYGVRE
jgi:hypothetical protein